MSAKRKETTLEITLEIDASQLADSFGRTNIVTGILQDASKFGYIGSCEFEWRDDSAVEESKPPAEPQFVGGVTYQTCSNSLGLGDRGVIQPSPFF